jgi:alanine-glyoxylate transaminase/serine-glyoxylate transaminase/serine-pyruvate transaminase
MPATRLVPPLKVGVPEAARPRTTPLHPWSPGTQRGTPFIFSGTGTGGWESALTNTLSPGDKVLTFRYGQFSHLWVDMMQRLGLEVEVYDRPWGEGADEAKVEEVLRNDTSHKIKAVCIVHNETTTGVTSDVGGVRAAIDAAKHPALLMVDGVSSIGALEFKFDDWRVDVAVTGSQKALSLPTGLALLCVSDKVRPAALQLGRPGQAGREAAREGWVVGGAVGSRR